MPNMISRQQAEALIQEQLINTIQQDAPKQSVFMGLARKLPNMTSKQTRIPVLDMLPMAYWVNGDTGFKQTSEQAWDNVYITAEELAVIVPIPEAVVADASFDILGEVQPRVMEAIGQRVDGAHDLRRQPPCQLARRHHNHGPAGGQQRGPRLQPQLLRPDHGRGRRDRQGGGVRPHGHRGAVRDGHAGQAPRRRARMAPHLQERHAGRYFLRSGRRAHVLPPERQL